MVDLEESQLFLAGDEALHVEESGGDIPKNLVAANKHFRRAVKGISIAMSALSSLNVIIFFGIFISIQVAQVSYTWQTTYAVLDIDVCILIAFIFITLNIFIQLPIVINILSDLVLSIVILIYATRVLSVGWPRQRDWCPSRDRYYDDPGVPADPRCLRFLSVSRILIGVSTGLSYVVGFMFLALLLMRIIAVSKTKFWKRAMWIAPGEYNYQLTFTISRKGEVGATASASGSSVQSRTNESEGQLI